MELSTDKDLFVTALEFLATSWPGDNAQSPDRYTSWLMEIMKNSCNVSTPKIVVRNGHRQVYWWTDEISNLRKAAVKARRRLTKCRQKNTQSIAEVTNCKEDTKSCY